MENLIDALNQAEELYEKNWNTWPVCNRCNVIALEPKTLSEYISSELFQKRIAIFQYIVWELERDNNIQGVFPFKGQKKMQLLNKYKEHISNEYIGAITSFCGLEKELQKKYSVQRLPLVI